MNLLESFSPYELLESRQYLHTSKIASFHPLRSFAIKVLNIMSDIMLRNAALYIKVHSACCIMFV